MSYSIQEMQNANLLRKSEKYSEALDIYIKLWRNKKDKFIAAGLLHCLRKKKKYEELQDMLDEIEPLKYNLDWLNNEIIWSHIETKLIQVSSDESLENVLKVANKIIELNPKGLALERIVFRVLKLAKTENRWDTAQEWIDKLQPEELSNENLKTEKGNTIWSKQSLWYYYKANILLNKGLYYELIELVQPLKGKFPRKQENLFNRLIALAYFNLEEYESSELYYSDICNHEKTDWWLLHEYANVLKNLGKSQQSLNLLFKSALKGKKIGNMVTLFYDIGLLCNHLGMKEEAYYHFLLSKLIRTENNWKISVEKYNVVEKLKQELRINDNYSIKELLNKCKRTWLKESDNHKHEFERTNIRRKLTGKVVLGKKENVFCFIHTSEESIFCYKSDLPEDLVSNMKVKFDAIKSFDKKKSKESWKAINIKAV